MIAHAPPHDYLMVTPDDQRIVWQLAGSASDETVAEFHLMAEERGLVVIRRTRDVALWRMKEQFCVSGPAKE